MISIVSLPVNLLSEEKKGVLVTLCKDILQTFMGKYNRQFFYNVWLMDIVIVVVPVDMCRTFFVAYCKGTYGMICLAQPIYGGLSGCG